MQFTVIGKPQAKQRPRFSRKGKYITTYTPNDTIQYEKMVKLSALEQCKEQLNKEYTGPIKMSIKVCFKPNKSVSKKQCDLLIGKRCLKRPDLDNLIKIICDGLNGIAYKDDSQVSILNAEKVYDNQERVEVIIEYEQ